MRAHLGSYGKSRQRSAPTGQVFSDRTLREIQELTSRYSTDQVSLARTKLGKSANEKDAVDVAMATNMISVGLDIGRLGLMLVQGQPKTAAEYIQASSRVGREGDKPGLVVTLLNVHKPRDRTHYEQFRAFHQSFYRAVEATSVTPFSTRALDRALAATLVAGVRHFEAELTPDPSASKLKDQLQAFDAVVSAITRKMALVGCRQDEIDRCVQRLEQLKDVWMDAADVQTTGGVGVFVYGTEQPVRRLLQDPNSQKANMAAERSLFVAGRSMRDTEPVIGLRLRAPNGMDFWGRSKLADTTQSFSQLLLTYGPGAMLDLPNHAVVVSGLQGWNYSGGHKQIEEERLVPLLRQQLGLGAEFTGLRAPPELDEERHDNARPAVDVVLFPKWFTVEDGGATGVSGAAPGETWRRMVEFSHLTITGDRMRFADDAGKKHDVNPIRFVAACSKGHLEDIEWRWLVHRNGDRTCKRSMFWVERGVSSDPSDISVRCSCGSRVTMADLYKPKFLGPCHAISPWLRPTREATDACAEDLQLLPRSATNTYFSQTITVISLTASNDRLLQVIAQHRSTIDAFRTLPNLTSILRAGPQTKDDFAGFSDDEIERAIASLDVDSETSSSQNPRIAEFDTLASGAETIGHGGAGSVLFAETLPRAKLVGNLQSIVKSVVKVNRLREVTCLYGFTRLEPPPSAAEIELDEIQLNVDGAPLTRQIQWLPAIEQFGEGIFVHIDEAELKSWLAKPAVTEVSKHMYEAESLDAARFGKRDERHMGPAYWAIHSLSHALMAELAMEGGYPLSSIKERIYSSAAGQLGRFGLLIYTSTAGAQGTLGGLSETAYRLPVILDGALRRVELCSNDPVCSEHHVGSALDERPLRGTK